MGNIKGFSHLLFLITISFLILSAGVATAFGLLGSNRPVPQRIICLADPQKQSCREEKTVNSWTLAVATIKLSDVTFKFAPSSDGRVSLEVVNLADGRIVFESGLIASGESSVAWNKAFMGNYTAVLNRGAEQVSNKVSLTISY
ncbi:TPA: hypothetical protein DIV55_06490 [Patescibacteria group bacterium]|uniref:Uncharacterized protein n=1 Tax=Candidatus Curtissbacteria bacterium GW2011_GWA1_40_16 TaxID=1618405 RepID=A0A0G0TUW4_9BACT|nr:MAG: hypothetical protein UT84_C0005G0026 [Candidatus Curtissbacteria bacterium GW2011_GWA1_40_16]HCS79352.1 hypothetical protein [Patescibacteria group bacterium]